VEKRRKKKLQYMWGHAVTEEEFSVGEKCASLKAATGMPAANGNESAMVAFVFCVRVLDGSEHD